MTTPGAPLAILYRGPLSSCNYGCEYCPFAKRVDTRAQLANDARALERFVGWVCARTGPTSVLFTPWGEALIRRPYQHALAALTRQTHVGRAAIQTNLSADIAWVHDCVPERLGLWATFHPDWVDRERFATKVCALYELGVRVSAGVVGLREHFPAIAALRRRLPADIYLWINAYKRRPDYYSAADRAWLREIDPLFPVNNRYHRSRGYRCRSGDSAISVDGRGDARRCHFIPEVIGNIYDPDFESRLQPRPCSNDTCGCHIGYVHLERLRLDSVFGSFRDSGTDSGTESGIDCGILERVPVVPRARLVQFRLPGDE